MPRTLLCICLAAAAAGAQSVSGPVLGWSAAPGGGIRIIYGVPGAARSATVRIPGGLRVLRMSPVSSSTLAASGQSKALVIYDLATGDTTPLDGALPSPAAAEFSPRGTSILLLDGTGSAQVWKRDSAGFSLSDRFQFTAGRAAVSDDGSAVLGDTGGALVLRSAGMVTTLTAAPVDSFTFVAGTSMPAFHTAGQLVVGANPALLDGAVQLASPVPGRVLALRDGTRLTLFDASGAVLADEALDTPASGFAAVGRPDTVELIGTPGNLLWLYDASVPRRFFVPAPQLRRFERSEAQR